MLESPHRGDSNKYPKHMFYEEIRKKQQQQQQQKKKKKKKKNRKKNRSSLQTILISDSL